MVPSMLLMSVWTGSLTIIVSMNGLTAWLNRFAFTSSFCRSTGCWGSRCASARPFISSIIVATVSGPPLVSRCGVWMECGGGVIIGEAGRLIKREGSTGGDGIVGKGGGGCGNAFGVTAINGGSGGDGGRVVKAVAVEAISFSLKSATTVSKASKFGLFVAVVDSPLVPETVVDRFPAAAPTGLPFVSAA